jgi:hypothetical protein
LVPAASITTASHAGFNRSICGESNVAGQEQEVADFMAEVNSAVGLTISSSAVNPDEDIF